MALLLRTPFRATALADAGRNRSSGGSYELPSSRSVKKKKLSAARLSSSSNPFVKHCVKLRLSSSYRRSQGSALVVGLTPIMEVCRFWQLNSGELSNIECLLLLDGMEIPEMLNLPSISIVHVSLHVIKKLSGVQSVDSTEAVALIKIPRSFYDMLGEHKEEIYPSWFPLPNRLLVLDGIQGVIGDWRGCSAQGLIMGKVEESVRNGGGGEDDAGGGLLGSSMLCRQCLQDGRNKGGAKLSNFDAKWKILES
ncbi:hypothetical protein KSP40_PGU003277 [Platanthera guangdongensis]|uniref:Uncharacterized protein n=1 Tax=Platanthera guangdongensis TaxID=2320717 RepID=A0ABR2MF75_9ASPA